MKSTVQKQVCSLKKAFSAYIDSCDELEFFNSQFKHDVTEIINKYQVIQNSLICDIHSKRKQLIEAHKKLKSIDTNCSNLIILEERNER